jgi:hypothetical protein
MVDASCTNHVFTRSRRRLGMLLVLLAAASLALAAAAPHAAVGATWGLQTTVAPGRPERMESVSCTSERACMAVGQYTSGTREPLGLTATWNGTSWTQQTAALPREATGSEFYDVSCTAETACTAVGKSQVTISGILFSTAALAERWNGREWAVQTLAAPARGTARLNGVSCASATSCVAVGTASEGGGSEILVESWSGTEWSVQTTPRAAGVLLDVSCTSSSACTAVGYRAAEEGRLVTLALRWDGREWRTQTTPNSAAIFNFLLDVSCGTSSSCVAVGEWEARSGARSFTAVWNGTSWTSKEVPTPVGTEHNVLFGVSCTSERACISVGDYRTRPETAIATLAEQWDGERWTLQTSPNPVGSRQTVLRSVSCTSSVLCTAAGTSEVLGQESLVERYS